MATIAYRWILLLLCLTTGCQPAEEALYPSRPVTFLVPWNPGGGTDTGSRTLAAVLQDYLNQPVSVVNRTGGGGVVGHLALARAAPDGYTIGAITVEITMMHWMGLTPLSIADYTPLALLTVTPSAITVHDDAPWETVDDLVSSLRAEPGEYLASGTSRGGIWDLARIGFLEAAGLPETAMPWVPSQGAAPALQELLAGGVDVVTAAFAETDALRKAGRVRVLAVMAEERLHVAPEVPTLEEQGINWSLGWGWTIVAGPAGIPDTIRTRLTTAIQRATQQPAFHDPLIRAGFQLPHMYGAELDTFVQKQDKIHRDLLTHTGLASR